MIFRPPPYHDPYLDDNGKISIAWMQWIEQTHKATTPLSGTTAQRPVKNLYPGMMYTDTSLGAHGKPIYVNKTSDGWIDAVGNPV